MLFRGQTLGKYKIIAPLGSGGFGTVYLAQDTWIDKKVAIKVPHRQNLDFGELLREPRLLASLSHPNIVTVLTAEKQDDVFFIVMEYVPGDTLEAMIERGRGMAVTVGRVRSCPILDLRLVLLGHNTIRGAAGASDLAAAVAWVARNGTQPRLVVIGDGVITAGAELATVARVERVDVEVRGEMRGQLVAQAAERESLRLTSAAQAEKAAEVVDIMEALKRSMERIPAKKKPPMKVAAKKKKSVS